MKESSEIKRNKLTKKDITHMSCLSFVEQLAFNFERMQAAGFCYSMAPYFKKIYGDNDEQVALAMKSNMDFINTEMHMATFLQGLILSLEEHGENRKLIQSIKTGLFGPLAGLGDAIFWFTLLPISAAIAVSLNNQGSILGPIIFIAIWLFAAFSRIWFGRLGYSLGTNAVSFIKENASAITKGAGILGVMVVGALIPSYVSFAFPSELMIFGTVQVQGIFDTILPNILPFGFTFLLYWLLKDKNINVTKLIVGIILFGVLMSLLGIM